MAVYLEPGFDKVLATQHIFRQLLAAGARPGTVCSLPRYEINPPMGLNVAMAAIAFTLLDTQVGLALVSGSPIECGNYIQANTGVRLETVEKADFVLLCGRDSAPLDLVKVGTLIAPHTGATLLVMVEELVSGIKGSQGSIVLKLRGPGIREQAVLSVKGLAVNLVTAICDLNCEFPLGVDVIFADNAGCIAAVPRSAVIVWEEGA